MKRRRSGVELQRANRTAWFRLGGVGGLAVQANMPGEQVFAGCYAISRGVPGSTACTYIRHKVYGAQSNTCLYKPVPRIPY